LRWWDYWLKGVETGIMTEPLLRAWIQDSQPPRTYYRERPGHWVAEPAWPSPHITPQTYGLNAGPAASQLDGVLAHPATAAIPLRLQGSQITGIETGPWTTYDSPGDYPANQQADDGKSLIFTSAALSAPVEILGFPRVRLIVAVDQPLGFLAVRLGDVAPDGSSTLVSWGVLNLTHRDSHEFPTPMVPGEAVTVTVQLNMIGYRLPAGHRWRVAVSPTHWPIVWPSPHPVTLTLFTGEASRLILPVRPPQAEDSQLPPFGPPEAAAPLPVEILRQNKIQRQKSTDIISGRTEVRSLFDFGRIRFKDNGLEYEDVTTNIYSIQEGDPLSAIIRCDQLLAFQRGEWQVRLETSSTMTADASHFHISQLLDGYEGQARVFTKTWRFTIPRDMG
jgi:hypothetical protein